MTDIVEELRIKANELGGSQHAYGEAVLYRRAADEIERLRNQWPQAEVAVRDAEIYRLRDEIEKLRGELVPMKTALFPADYIAEAERLQAALHAILQKDPRNVTP